MDLRILHITTEYPPIVTGGMAYAVSGLVEASVKTGIKIIVIHVRDLRRKEYNQPSLVKPVNTSQSRVIIPIVLNVFRISDALDLCLELARKWKPDIVHVHKFCLLPLAYSLKKQTGDPIVYTIHSLEREEAYPCLNPLEYMMRSATQQELITIADRIIVLCEEEKNLLRQYYPGVDDRIRIAGNGIDFQPSKYNLKSKTRLHTSNIILYVGRFVERKGVQDLLEAIPAVLDRITRTQFVLVGGQTIYDSSREMERNWLTSGLVKYRNHITFTGWIDAHEVEEWYGLADILVVPSRYEPFGMVVLEGMKRGLPIVASAVGGPMEILEHGRTGFLFPRMDKVALSYYLLMLLNNLPLRKMMGASGIKEISNKWKWSQIVSKVREIYQEIIT